MMIFLFLFVQLHASLTSSLEKNAILGNRCLRRNHRDDFWVKSSRHNRCESERIGISRSTIGSVRVSSIDRRASLHNV